MSAARRSALRAAGGTRIAVFAVGGLSLLAFYFWTHRPAPQDAAIARAVVDAAYASAERGDLSDVTYDRYQWTRLQNRYGRVLSYRIVSDRYLWGPFRLGADFEYEVDVHRERAHSRENVQVAAHRSRLYGYWSGVDRLTSESTTP